MLDAACGRQMWVTVEEGLDVSKTDRGARPGCRPIGATILAVWFFVIDTIEGRPFYTPALLASNLAHVEGVDRSVALITLYTVLHYLAFFAVGLLAAWVMSRLETCPSLLLGLVLGFVLFDLVFYLSLVLTGVDVVDEFGWPEVLSGNLLAGVGLMGYLHYSLRLRSPSWLQTLAQHRIVREGVVVGVLGAIAVAVWFLIFDLFRGQIFLTPGALGSAVFYRIGSAAEVQVGLLTVAGYTIVHFAAFILVGLVAAAIAVEAEKTPPLLLAGVLIFATFEAFFLGVVAEWLLGVIGWVSIGLGNLLATVVMATYLLRAHPELRAALGRPTLAGEDVELEPTEARDRL